MSRVFLFFVFVTCIASCVIYSKNQEQLSKSSVTPSFTSNFPNQSEIDLEGVYEFVSSTKIIISPEPEVKTTTQDEWQGFWFFQQGRFTKTMMKYNRPEWTPRRFPTSAEGTGFDGISGNYRIKNGQLELDNVLAFYPGARSDNYFYSFSFDNNILTLKQKFGKSKENWEEGEEVIILRKLEKNNL